MTFVELREQTPAVKLTYLDTPCRGLTPKCVANAGAKALEGWHSLADSVSNKTYANSVKHKIARLLEVSKEEIALTTSTSHGLNIIANAIKWQPGDNVVVADCEHPSNFYPWLHLRNIGVEVRLVSCSDGFIDTDVMKQHIDSKTKAVAASLITFYPGAMLDVAALADAAHTQNALIVIDAVQAIGIQPVYPKKLGIDILASAAYKGLMCPHGSGFVYCDERILDRLQPSQIFMTSIEGPLGVRGHYSNSEYKLKETATKLEPMSSHLVGLAMMDQALSLILDLSVEQISEHVNNLAQMLTNDLEELGLGTKLPAQSQGLAHLVSIDRKDAAQIVEFAQKRDVICSHRRTGVRFGLHAYNTAADIERTVAVLGDYLK